MLILPALAPVTFTSPFDKIFAVVGVSIFVMLPPAILMFATVFGASEVYV